MLEVNIPFPNMVFEFFLWIVYQDHNRLLKSIHYLHEFLEVYAIAKLFKVKQELGLTEILLKNKILNWPGPFGPT